MRRLRSLVLPCLIVSPLLTTGQLVFKKSLLMHLGGGASFLALSSEVEELSASGLTGGTVEFSFGYAFSPKWSLGFHYLRLGTDHYTEDIDRLRITRYELERGYRLLNQEDQAVELTLGIGAGLLALHDRSERLPVEALTRSLSAGARYIRLFSKTVGAYAGVNTSPGGDGAMMLGGQEILDANGRAVLISWNSVSTVVGVAVRF